MSNHCCKFAVCCKKLSSCSFPRCMKSPKKVLKMSRWRSSPQKLCHSPQVTFLLVDNTHSTTISKFINDRWCWRIKMLLAQKKESSPESFIKASHKHLSVSNCCQVKLGKRHNYPNYKIGAKFKFHSTVNLQSGLWQRLKPHHHHHHHQHRHDHHNITIIIVIIIIVIIIVINSQTPIWNLTAFETSLRMKDQFF